MTYLNLINQLIQEGYLKTPRIIKAFQKINRADFLPDKVRDEAELNIPLSIGYGQTISQPLTVAFMLELLAPEKGDKVLDVGSGSGWSVALLAEIVGEKGKVYAVERIFELKEFGERNVAKYNFVASQRVKFFCLDGSKGLKEFAPFSRIIVAAGTAQIPLPLKEQLAVGGRLVIPVGIGSQDMIVIEKLEKDRYKENRYPGFVFVPLIESS